MDKAIQAVQAEGKARSAYPCKDNNGELAMSASGGCSRVCLGSSPRLSSRGGQGNSVLMMMSEECQRARECNSFD